MRCFAPWTGAPGRDTIGKNQAAAEWGNGMPVDMKVVIATAFAQMARKKPIDKITVKDLVEQCGISRQAFYYHFQDILEVMEWSIRQMVESTLQTSLRAQTPQEAIEAFVSVAAEHGELLMRLLDSQRRAQIEHVFVEALRSNMRRLLGAKRPDLAVNHQDLEVALSFCAYGIAGVLFENCRNRDLDVKLLSWQLSQMLSGNLI